jgi:HSP20 family protein
MTTELKGKEIEKRQPAAATRTERSRTTPVFTPATDIYETADAFVLLADMPGVSEDTVEAKFEQGVLTISGRVPQESFDEYQPCWLEYRTGNYERTFAISEQIDADKIEGTVKNGVLRLVLPKAEAVKPKLIKVKAG